MKEKVKAISILSHNLMEEQIKDLEENFGVDQIIIMPAVIAERWSSIEPSAEQEYRDKLYDDVRSFIVNNSNEHDYVIIQGEWGMTYRLVKMSFENNRIPIYASTRRIAKEIAEEGRVRVERVFVHSGFKKYGY